MGYLAHLLNVSGIYAILAMSLNLLVGYSGLVSLAHGAFFGVGAYAFSLVLLHYGVNFLIGIACAMVVTAALAALTALPALRTRADYLILLTLGFQVIIFSLLRTQRGLTGGQMGLGGIPRPRLLGIEVVTPVQFLPLVLAAALICFIVLWHITRSPFGRLLRSMRSDEDLLRSVGKNVVAIKLSSFMLAGAVAALGGGLFATYTTFLTPSYFKVDTSILVLAMVALGGMGNLVGSVVGALVLTLVPAALTFLGRGFTIAGIVIAGGDLVGPIQGLLYGCILVVVMRFRPQGLISETWGSKRPSIHALQPAVIPREEHLGEVSRWLAQAHSEGGTGTAAAVEVAPKPKENERGRKPNANRTVLEARGLSRSFGGIKAVNDLSFKLREGQISALIGANGAGKTTAFNLITGFLDADGGRVLYGGADITNLPAHRIARSGVVRSWQGARVFDRLTVIDNVLVSRATQISETLWRLLVTPRAALREEAIHQRVAWQLLRLVGLHGKAIDLARDLSFAEQKLLQLACLLATEAEILLLDEPVAGVDPLSIGEITTLLRGLAAQGKTICIIEHNLDVVRDLADVAFFLDQGGVVMTDTPARLMREEKLVDLYFGV